jgi:3-hydroxyacyl-CoA dehydrogenase
MGGQIAGWGARSGLEVTLYDAKPGQAEAARAECERHGVAVRASEDLRAALEGADWVAEAVFEELELKLRVLAQIDHESAPDAIVTSNSSMIIPSRMAGAFQRPARFMNVHFLPPVGVVPIVEVIPHPSTDPGAVDSMLQKLEASGLEPVLIRKEIPGFIINTVLGMLLRAAFELVEQGVASAEEIDRAITRGLGHGIGPLRLADYIGLDTALRAGRSYYEQVGGIPPSPLLERLVAEGKLGVKSGEGFYTYS